MATDVQRLEWRIEDLENLLGKPGGEVSTSRVEAPAPPRNVKHSSESVRWFTPVPVISRAAEVMGRIDLDPASEPIANEIVQATRIITEAEDGLVAPWTKYDDGRPWRFDGEAPVTVWLNPPGGKRGSVSGEAGKKGAGNRSLAGLFWERLIRERDAGNVEQAIFLAFNLELLQTTQRKAVPAIGTFLCCVPFTRIKFWKAEGKPVSPTHGNVIAYVPGTVDASEAFIREFADFGTITQGVKR
jgi:hypothetical protein